jgi:hypothetical protein
MSTCYLIGKQCNTFHRNKPLYKRTS